MFVCLCPNTGGIKLRSKLLHAHRSRGVQCDAPAVQVGALLSPTSVKQRRRAPAQSTPPSVLLEGHKQELDSSRQKHHLVSHWCPPSCTA
ncbi:hypothetical protein SRHO_G00154100 [Serrasalmus rhombeus]